MTDPTTPVPLATARPAGRLGATGALLALVVLGVGVLLAQDGLTRLGVLGGPAWTESATSALGTVRPTWPVAAVGVVVALAGLVVLVTALRPRRREGEELAGHGGVVVLDADVARLASAAAAGVPGVLRARSVRTRRSVVVHVATDGGAGVRDAVHDAVGERLALLAAPTRVDVRARGPQAAGDRADATPPRPVPGPARQPADARALETTEVDR